MTYKFYGCEKANCLSINNEYKGINNPIDLYNALSNIWCEYSCAPRLRNNWNENNKTLGQCSITAFLAQDIFGGKVYGIPRPDGSYHCYNVVNDCIFDLTSEQFGDEILDYSLKIEQFRDTHFSDENKRERYEYLCNKLKEFLAKEDYLINKHSKNIGLVLLSCLILLNYLFKIFISDSYMSDSRAAYNQTIPINIGNQTYHVIPGQWVTVNTPSGPTCYNVRFVDGKPVALDMSSYQNIIFGQEAPKAAEAAKAESTTEKNQQDEWMEIIKGAYSLMDNGCDMNGLNRDSSTQPNPINPNYKSLKVRKNTINNNDTFLENPHKNSIETDTKRKEEFPFVPNPTKDKAAQTNYPIVYNAEIIEKEDDDDDKEDEDKEKDNIEEKVS